MTLMAGCAALSVMALWFLEETLSVTQHSKISGALPTPGVEQEVPEANEQRVLSFLVVPITNFGHQNLALSLLHTWQLILLGLAHCPTGAR